MEEDWDSWVATIRQLVLSSKSPLTTEEINKKLKLLRGRDIPFKKFQYKTLAVMLNMIPGMIVCEKNNDFYVLAEAKSNAIHFRETSKISYLEKTLKSIHQKFTKSSINESINKNELKNFEPYTRISDKNSESQTYDNAFKSSDTSNCKNMESGTKISDNNKSQVNNNTFKNFDPINYKNLSHSQRSTDKSCDSISKSNGFIIKETSKENINSRNKCLFSSKPAPPLTMINNTNKITSQATIQSQNQKKNNQPSPRTGRFIKGINNTSAKNFTTTNASSQPQNYCGISQSSQNFYLSTSNFATHLQQKNYGGSLQANRNIYQSTSNIATHSHRQYFNINHNINNMRSTPIPQTLNSNQDVISLTTSLQQQILTITQKTQTPFNSQQNVTVNRDPQTINWQPNDPRLHLYCYAKARNIAIPQYKYLYASNFVYAVVSVESKTFSSYPYYVYSLPEAEKIAASNALESLLGKTIKGNFIFHIQQEVMRLSDTQIQNLKKNHAAYSDPLTIYYVRLWLIIYYYSVWYLSYYQDMLRSI